MSDDPGQSVSNENARFRVGRWIVDVAAHQLVGACEERRLEPQVMRVLVYLARNAGRVIPKSELIRELWSGVVVEDAALTRCISQIRRSLDDHVRHPTYIETVPKSGYRFIMPVEKLQEPNRKTPLVKVISALTITAAIVIVVATGLLHEGDKFRSRNVQAQAAYEQGVRLYDAYDYSDNENAIAYFERALELDPDFAHAHAGMANALARQAVLYSGRQTDEALRHAQRATQLAPQSAAAYKALGLAYSVRRDNDAALSAYERSLEIDPAHWQSAFNSAFIYKHRQQLELAEARFLQVLDRVPGHSRAMSALADVYLSQGKLEEARRWLNRSLDEVPMQPDATIVYATLEFATGDRNIAIERCKAMMNVFGDEYDCLRMIAAAALTERNFDAADATVQRLRRNWPDDRYAALSEAQVHLGRGQNKIALDIIGNVIVRSQERLQSTDHTWNDFWLIGAAYALQGNHQQALDCLERAVAEGYTFFLWDAVEPAFDQIRQEQRFQDYLYAMESGIANRG